MSEIPILVGKIPSNPKDFQSNEFLPENPGGVGGLTPEEKAFLSKAAKEVGVKDFGNQ